MTRGTGVAGTSPARAFLGTSLSSVAVALLTFVSGALIARALGPEARADYGTVLLIGQTVATLGCLSFFDGAIVRLRAEPGLLGSALPSMLFAGLAISGLSAGAAFVVLSLGGIGPEGMTPARGQTIAALIILDTMLWQCFSAAERSRMDFFLVNLSRALSPAAFSLLVAVAWIVQGGDLSAWLVLLLFLLSRLPVLVVWSLRYARQIVGPLSWSFLRDTGRIGFRDRRGGQPHRPQVEPPGTGRPGALGAGLAAVPAQSAAALGLAENAVAHLRGAGGAGRTRLSHGAHRHPLEPDAG